jgi:hypothetical protein
MLVVWGSTLLTLGQKVVWYRDWTLDMGGPDGCYASPQSLSAGLGGSLTPGTIETTRQLLKRLGLHYPIDRRRLDREVTNQMGWVATLPAECYARHAKEAAVQSRRLDAYLEGLDVWKERMSRSHVLDDQKLDSTRVEPEFYRDNRRSVRGGRGGLSSKELCETQLPSGDTDQEKGDRSSERNYEKREPISSAEAFAKVREAIQKRREA